MNRTVKTSFADLYPLIRDAIDKGNSFSFVAFGNSMHPYIRGGKDTVTLSPLSRDICPNDVVFYRRDCGTFVLHRVIKIKDNLLQLCGDNQFLLEKDIRTDQVIAILTHIDRSGKRITPKRLSSSLWTLYLPFRRFFRRTLYLCKRLVKKLIKG